MSQQTGRKTKVLEPDEVTALRRKPREELTLAETLFLQGLDIRDLRERLERVEADMYGKQTKKYV